MDLHQKLVWMHNLKQRESFLFKVHLFCYPNYAWLYIEFHFIIGSYKL